MTQRVPDSQKIGLPISVRDWPCVDKLHYLGTANFKHKYSARGMIIFNNISVFWWIKPEYQEKIIDLPPVTDKLHHIMLSLVLRIRVKQYPPNHPIVDDMKYV